LFTSASIPNLDFFQHMSLHTLNFTEVKFIATINHDYIKEKGGVTLRDYIYEYAEFTLLYFT
jgi:uncharacterized protein YutD